VNASHRVDANNVQQGRIAVTQTNSISDGEPARRARRMGDCQDYHPEPVTDSIEQKAPDPEAEDETG